MKVGGESMRPMVCFAALLFAASLGAVAAQAQSAPDTLWQKAVLIAGRNLNWVPGLIVTRADEVDDQDRVKSTQESWVRMRPGDDGQPVTETEKLIRNGKDETERAKRDEAEQRAREQEAKRRTREATGDAPPQSAVVRFGGPTPFDPEVQDSVSYRRLEPAATDSAGTVGYEFSETLPEGVIVRGTARLVAASGVPLEMRFTTDPLPKRVKELAVVVRFATDEKGAWWPSTISFRAMGKLLFFKKRFRSAMTFSEYWWREPR
jgi:hypothetical protein